MASRSKSDRFDPELLDDWHAIADVGALPAAEPFTTRLFGVPIAVERVSDGALRVTRTDTGQAIPFREQYGFLWACLGEPFRDVLHVPEAFEDDRYVVTGGSIVVHVSGLRAVENFLDMGHFPFVHTGWLGEEPHTEVPSYKVEVTEEDEVLATECSFYQPVASPTADGGIMVDYTYKVSRPHTVALYKTNPVQPDRMDYIALFVQPVNEENRVAHPPLCYLKHDTNEAELRWFMQLIFAQDKPILENQLPRRLPLDPRAETPIRADKSAIAYRQWLRSKGVTYGVIPSAA